MKILVVEDSEKKSEQLLAFLTREFSNLVVAKRKSYNSGLAAVQNLSPDVILLDMSMPTFDRSGPQTGGRTRYFAGRDVLREIKRRKLPARAIIVTQFDTFGEGTQHRTLHELRAELEREFPGRYLGTVYYHPSRFDWKMKLKELLERAGANPKTDPQTDS